MFKRINNFFFDGTPDMQSAILFYIYATDLPLLIALIVLGWF